MGNVLKDDITMAFVKISPNDEFDRKAFLGIYLMSERDVQAT